MLLVLFPDVGTRSEGSSIDQDKFQGSYEGQGVTVSRLFIIAAKDRSSKSSNSKDVSSYKCSHCVDVPGDVENVPMFGRDRSECLNVAVVHWHDQNRSMLNEGPTLPGSSIFLSIERCSHVTVTRKL